MFATVIITILCVKNSNFKRLQVQIPNDYIRKNYLTERRKGIFQLVNQGSVALLSIILKLVPFRHIFHEFSDAENRIVVHIHVYYYFETLPK